MDVVRLLSDMVANQIAAGEVIQRPASVVKELLENAIDAGAHNVQLVIKDAGRTLIQVIDDGKGMSFNDARMCFERHATSKLTQVDDLSRLTTKGFRGEAMASIAAIAHVELKTGQPDEAVGTRVCIEGTRVTAHERIAAQKGTSIAVKNLFFNVPARRNFLKSDNVEMTHIEEEFYRVALIHHDIAFALYHNGKTVLQLQGSNFKQRIINVFGAHFKDKLFPVEQNTDFMSISGFIAKPENAKKKKSEQYMFINHRYVRHNLLNYAVETAYSDLIPQGYRPAYFIEIDVNPAAVDVNVSPTKVEVKLQDEKLMFGFLNAAVKRTLGTMSLVPRIDFESDPSMYTPPPPAGHVVTAPSLGVNPNYNPFESPSSPSDGSGNSGGHGTAYPHHDGGNLKGWDDFLKGLSRENTSVPQDRQLHIESPAPADTKVEPFASDEVPLEYFMVANRYLFIKNEGQALLVDVLNASERILYNRYVQALSQTPVRVQKNLFPETVTLTPSQADLLDTLIADFRKLGYDLEKMDNTHFAVNGTPNDEADRGDLQSLIERVLEAYRTNQFLHKADKTRNMALSMARQNRRYHAVLNTPEQTRAFLHELYTGECPELSPSGKRVSRVMGVEDLQQLFEK